LDYLNVPIHSLAAIASFENDEIHFE